MPLLARLHLFEFNDQSWLPKLLRDCFNDTIAFTHLVYQPYGRCAQPILKWAQHNKISEILDLGSAGGEHLIHIIRQARKLTTETNSSFPRIIASDLYPVPEQWQLNSDILGRDSFGYVPAPVNALSVSPNLPRYWSIFSALHHFTPNDVRAILNNLVQHGNGLCIAEYYDRSLYAVLMTLLATPINLLVPFLSRRPSLSKFIVTTLIPIVPIMSLVDGISSVFRTYSVEELQAMMPDAARDNFTFESRKVWYGRVPMQSTLIFITRKNPL